MAPRNSPRGNSSKKKEKLTKTLLVGPFRAAFVNIFDPEETDNGDRYSLTMLFPPDCPSIDEIHDAFEAVMDDYFGKEWPTGKKDTLPEDKFYDAKKKDYQGYKPGWMVLKASSTDAPGIIDADKKDVLNKREAYGGRWMRAQISITTFDNASKGSTAYLNHVQLLEHDEAFSGRGSAEDAFDKYEIKDKSRGRSRAGDDEDEGQGSRRGGRDRDRDDDRDNDRGGADRGSSRRSREDDEDDRGRGGSRRGKERDDNDEDEDRGSRRGRGRDEASAEDDDKPRGRGRGRDAGEDQEERPSRSGGRSRSREDEDEGEDRPSRRGSRSSSRQADDDDRAGRGSRRAREDDDGGWN